MLRIALLTPTFWPEVRRGTERLVHDLAVALGNRGHEVTLLTTHSKRTSESVEDGVRISRKRRPPNMPGLKVYEQHILTMPHTIRRLRSGGSMLPIRFSRRTPGRLFAHGNGVGRRSSPRCMVSLRASI